MASRIVGRLILAKGNLNKYDQIIAHALKLLKDEFQEQLAAEKEARDANARLFNQARDDEMTERRRADKAEADAAALRDIVDRGVKILWLAVPETREPVHSDSNNPITAWVADATVAIYAAKEKGK